MGRQPLSEPGPPHYRVASRSHLDTPYSVGLLWTSDRHGPLQRPHPNNIQHSQGTDIHDPGGIRDRIPSKRVAADSRRKPCGYWNRQDVKYV